MSVSTVAAEQSGTAVVRITHNEFRAAVRRVAGGGSAIDPAVAAQLVGSHRDCDPLAELTPRKREALERDETYLRLG